MAEFYQRFIEKDIVFIGCVKKATKSGALPQSVRSYLQILATAAYYKNSELFAAYYDTCVEYCVGYAIIALSCGMTESFLMLFHIFHQHKDMFIEEYRRNNVVLDEEDPHYGDVVGCLELIVHPKISFEENLLLVYLEMIHVTLPGANRVSNSLDVHMIAAMSRAGNYDAIVQHLTAVTPLTSLEALSAAHMMVIGTYIMFKLQMPEEMRNRLQQAVEGFTTLQKKNAFVATMIKTF